MNKARRELLSRAKSLLDQASGLVSNAADGEEEAMYNMPENLQDSEQYERFEIAVDLLNDASSCIDDAIAKLSEAIGV